MYTRNQFDKICYIYYFVLYQKRINNKYRLDTQISGEDIVLKKIKLTNTVNLHLKLYIFDFISYNDYV